MRWRVGTYALAALSSAAIGALPAAAALPDWAVALAGTAPAVPPTPSPWPARILLSEVRVAIQPDGALRIRRRMVNQALSVRTEVVSTGYFAFDAAARVTATRAWHLPPGEQARRSREMPVDLAAGDAFLSDNRVRMVPIQGVRKGSLVFFEFEAVERPAFLSLAQRFYEAVPVAVSRYEVETPPGWSVRAVWARGEGPAPTVQGLVSTWEIRDSPAPEDEPLAEAPVDRAPLLLAQVMPPAGAKLPAATWSDWPAVSAWYDDLSRGRAVVGPAIEAAVRRVVPAADAAFFETVGAASRFVRDSVRYTAIELGIGGYQPRPSGETLANLYGDCKDKGTLLRALLSARGIDSFAVLVRHGATEEVSEALPVWSFNHFIVAVPIPGGVSVPPAFRPAVAAAGQAPLLFVDTTDEHTAIGSLPAALEGRRGLLVDGSRGRLVVLPGGDPSAHVTIRRTDIDTRPGGALTLRRTSTMSGEFAAQQRLESGRSALDRRRRVEGAVTHRWPDAAISDYQVTEENDDGRFEESLTIVRKGVGQIAGPGRVPLFPWLDEEIPQVPLGKRRLDIVYPHSMTIRHETAITGVPLSAALPPSRALTGPGWSVSFEVRRDGEKVVGRAEVLLSKSRFKPDEFPELRRFWSALSGAAGSSVAMETEGPGS